MLNKIALVASALTLGAAEFQVPTVEIAKGVNLPLVGLGTWLYNDTVAYDACKSALAMGYPHIDTAFAYDNLKGLGNCIKEHFAATGKPRSSLFVTSKVMGGVPGAAGHTMAELAEINLKEIQLDYFDLVLLHYPCVPSADGKSCDGGAAGRQKQWKSVEGLVASGKARAIGVSHYCPHHLKDIFEIMTVKPALNQVQFHVGMGNAVPNATDGKSFDKLNGVLYQSFSPLCGPCGKNESHALIAGPLVSGIGAKYGKTGAQVSLKWQVQQGIPVIPKTGNPKHQAENIDLFGDWTLSDADMAALTATNYPPVAAGPGPTDSGDCGLI